MTLACSDPLSSSSHAPSRSHPPWLRSVIRHGISAFPREACGVIVRDNVGAQLRAIRLGNEVATGTGFRFAPAELLKLAVAGRKSGGRWVGVYHSHPSAPAVLSAADVRLGAALNGVAQVIVAVENREAASIGFFLWRAGAYEPVEQAAFEGFSGVAW